MLTTRAPAEATATPVRVAIPTSLWPLIVLSLGLPALFLVGLASVAWSLPGLVFGAALLVRRGVAARPGSGLLVALVAWVLLSGTQVRGMSSLALFGYRASLFVSLAATFIWICDAPRDRRFDAAVVRVVGWTFPIVVAFGWLAILMPQVSTDSLFLRLLPAGLADHPFMVDIASVRLAEVQGFLGYPVNRPSAPFAYANTWGSVVGITFPFFVADWVVGQARGRRRWGMVVLAAAVVPVVVSLNRGLWVSGALALGYVALRRAVRGDLRTLVRLVLGAVLVVVVALASPLGGLVQGRLDRSADSNETRQSVAREALDRGLESPLLGYGAPSSETDSPVAVGSHGLLWYLVYSHGFVAAGLFLAWLLGTIRRGLRLADERGVWLAAVPMVALAQMPIYNVMPHLLLVGVAGALVVRAATQETPGLG